jgi:hypothetical protein
LRKNIRGSLSSGPLSFLSAGKDGGGDLLPVDQVLDGAMKSTLARYD